MKYGFSVAPGISVFKIQGNYPFAKSLQWSYGSGIECSKYEKRLGLNVYHDNKHDLKTADENRCSYHEHKFMSYGNGIYDLIFFW